MQCPGRGSGAEKTAKPDCMDGGTESNPHVRWCGRGDGRNPVTSTRFAFLLVRLCGLISGSFTNDHRNPEDNKWQWGKAYDGI